MINYYLSKIASLRKRKKCFDNLLKSLNFLLPDLTNSSKHLSDASESIMKSFVIDLESIDKNSIKLNKETLENVEIKLKGSVIPAIKKEILNIDRKIDYYNLLIEEEEE